MDHDDFGTVKQASIGTSEMERGMESNDGQEMDQEWNQMFEMMERAEVSDFVVNSSLKFESAPSGRLPRSRDTPNLINQSETIRNVINQPETIRNVTNQSETIRKVTNQPETIRNVTNQSETVRNQSTPCSRTLKFNTQSYNYSSPKSNVKLQIHIQGFDDHSHSEKQINRPEMEKHRAQELGFRNTYSTLCYGPLKGPTQSLYQSNNCMKHVKESQDLGMEMKSLMYENSQRNHKVESNFTRGTSRSETCNCPPCSSELRSLKNTTQSYSYSNSSEDESERIERKEKERYERRLIREHLKQKSKDQSYEYCLESFEYAGQNLADTDETDGGITVSDWSEPDPNKDSEADEIFVGYFEDSEALQEEDKPTTNDPRLIQPIGIYRNLGQIDQKPTHLSLRQTEIPIPPSAPRSDEPKQYVLPEAIPETDSMLSRVKQEVQEPTQKEEPVESERITTSGITEIVEHDPIVSFRDSSIPLSTDFTERGLPLISNKMGPAPLRFRNDIQEQEMRTVANENESINGSTNDPDPKFTGSTGLRGDQGSNKVSTNTRDKGKLIKLSPPPDYW